MKNWRNILEMQRVLDEEVSEPRPNGFVPGERNRVKIVLSAIAECIEFNEETPETHKTWKQRKEVSGSAILEELTDILFFIAQLSNLTEHNQDIFCRVLSKPAAMFGIYKKDSLVTKLIERLTQGDIGNILECYKALVADYDFSMEEIQEEYERKWHINMQRISGEWSIKK